MTELAVIEGGLNEYVPLPDGVSLYGCWLMVADEVNIDDLVHGGQGRVIRMMRADSLRYIPPSLDDYERIAGMISDAA
jgi:hypothetical protein